MCQYFRSSIAGQHLWMMQGGAQPHCTNGVKVLLLEEPNQRVISRRNDTMWPTHNPGIDPLDYHFWSAVQNQAYRQKIQNVE